VCAACVASLLLFPRVADPDAGRPAGRDGGTAAVDRLATAGGGLDDGAGPVDADGVQRRVGSGEAAAVSLTFDDGPDPRWTPAVLDLLRRYRVRATFCLVGRHVTAYPDLVRRIATDGHLLCDHTWSHDGALDRRGRAAVRAELTRAYDAITTAAGVRPRYFRAPGGRWSPAVVSEARRLRLRPLGWSVDPKDWTKPPAVEITRRVLTGTSAGDIVLLHDGYGDRSRTVAALRTILATLTARRLTLTTP